MKKGLKIGLWILGYLIILLIIYKLPDFFSNHEFYQAISRYYEHQKDQTNYKLFQDAHFFTIKITDYLFGYMFLFLIVSLFKTPVKNKLLEQYPKIRYDHETHLKINRLMYLTLLLFVLFFLNFHFGLIIYLQVSILIIFGIVIIVSFLFINEKKSDNILSRVAEIESNKGMNVSSDEYQVLERPEKEIKTYKTITIVLTILLILAFSHTTYQFYLFSKLELPEEMVLEESFVFYDFRGNPARTLCENQGAYINCYERYNYEELLIQYQLTEIEFELDETILSRIKSGKYQVMISLNSNEKTYGIKEITESQVTLQLDLSISEFNSLRIGLIEDETLITLTDEAVKNIKLKFVRK